MGPRSEGMDAADPSPGVIRVLYAAPGLVYRAGCGPSEHVCSLARALARLDRIRVTVLFAGLGDPPPGREPFTVATLDVSGRKPAAGLETDALVLGVNPFHYLAYAAAVRRFGRDAAVRFHVLLERMWGYGGHLARAFRRAGKTVILEENGPPSGPERLRSPADFLRRLYLEIARHRLARIYRLGRRVVVQTPALAEFLSRAFGLTPSRLRVVPNGVDPSRFERARPPRGRVRSNAPLAVFAGTLDADHDLGPLVAAACERPGKVELHILGSGPERARLEAYAAARGGGSVRFLGRRPPEEAARWIAAADLCIAAYGPKVERKEGCLYAPLKLAEYAAAGKAAAVAGAGPGPEVGPVVNGVNGFTLPNRKEAWLELLDRLPGKAELARMGAKGKERVAHLTWEGAARAVAAETAPPWERPSVIPLPFANPGNRYTKALHEHLERRGVRLVDGGALPLSRIRAEAGAADLIHLHWPESHYQFPGRLRSFAKWIHLRLRLAAALRLGYGLVWTAHNVEAHDPRLRALDRVMRRFLLRRAAVVLPGQGSRDLLARALGLFPAGPQAVIRHGHYIEAYGPQVERTEARARLDLPEDRPVFLFLGALRPYKGVEVLLDVFPEAAPEGAILLVAGGPSEGPTARAAARAAAARPGRIRFHPGFVPDEAIPLFLGAASFVVLPYRRVHLSGSLVLALSYARPVIAPDLGVLGEYLPGDAGILYDPVDPRGLAEALRAAASADPCAMGEKGYGFAQSLDWEEIAEAHFNLYRSVLRPRAVGEGMQGFLAGGSTLRREGEAGREGNGS